MSLIEIIVVSAIGLFAMFALLSLLGHSKKTKAAQKKVKVSQTEEKKDDTSSAKPNEDRSFKITKKGVVKIKKESTKRDSRTETIIEKVDVKKEAKATKSTGYDNFDDFLGKLKQVGNPDELDDETFDQMFGIKRGDVDLDFVDDGEASISSPTFESKSSDLKHFTIDGSHLELEKSYEGLPIRRPTIGNRIEFTDRITGRYENITAGDVSNRIQVSKAVLDDKDDADENDEVREELSDEDIFAKIMERRRRELGMEEPNTKSNNDSGIDPKTLVIASAIMEKRHAKNN